MNIALKEASETEYWLELLYETDYIDNNTYTGVTDDCRELIRILVAITKTQKYPKNPDEPTPLKSRS